MPATVLLSRASRPVVLKLGFSFSAGLATWSFVPL